MRDYINMRDSPSLFGFSHKYRFIKYTMTNTEMIILIMSVKSYDGNFVETLIGNLYKNLFG